MYLSDAPITPPIERWRVVVRRRQIPIFNFKGDPLARVRRHVVDVLKVAFGIRPTLITASLENAERASSYHLEIRGPANTYFSSQSLENTLGDPVVPVSHFVPAVRQGQRHAKIYLRGASETVDWSYAVVFSERMPGSLAPAAIAAAAVAALTWIELIGLRANAELSPSWDFVTLMLGLPTAISIWVGVQSERNLMEGVLLSRMSSLITIGIALWSAISNLVGAGPQQQLLVALVSSANAAAMIAVWVFRSRVQSYFVGKPETSL
jgi:hypothetical protein